MSSWQGPQRPRRVGGSRLLTLLVLAAAIVPAATGLAPGRAWAVPPDVLDERALAIASPSLVYLETVYTGYIRDKQTNQPVLASPVTYNRRCSGFVVNPDGHVVTTRICVAPPDQTILQQALYVTGFVLVGEHQLGQSQIDSWVAARMNTTVFTGLTDNSKPDTQLFGQLNLATGAITAAPAIHGSVVKVSEPNNVALVKLAQGNLPAVQLADDGTIPAGTQVTALGFDTTDADPRIGTYTPEATSAQVVGSAKDGTSTYYRLSQNLGTYVHGGMAIDASGHIVGILNEDPTLPNNTNRAVYPASVVSSLLSSAGVSNTLGQSDKLYRSGLDAYFGGQYSTASSDLGRVAKAVPSNRTASVYRQYAVDRQAIEGDSSGLGTWFKPAVTGVGGGLLGALIVALVMTAGNRRRRAAAEHNWNPYAPPPPAYRQTGPQTATPAVQQQQPVPPQHMPPQQALPQAESAWSLVPSRYDLDPFAPTTQQQAPQQQVPPQQASQAQVPPQQQLQPQPVIPHQPQAAERDGGQNAEWNVVWPAPNEVPATIQTPTNQAPVAPEPAPPVVAEQPDPAPGQAPGSGPPEPGPDEGNRPRSPWAAPPTQP
jgi:hypothetical protein